MLVFPEVFPKWFFTLVFPMGGGGPHHPKLSVVCVCELVLAHQLFVYFLRALYVYVYTCI